MYSLYILSLLISWTKAVRFYVLPELLLIFAWAPLLRNLDSGMIDCRVPWPIIRSPCRSRKQSACTFSSSGNCISLSSSLCLSQILIKQDVSTVARHPLLELIATAVSGQSCSKPLPHLYRTNPCEFTLRVWLLSMVRRSLGLRCLY